MAVTKLLLPYEPTDILAQLAAHKAAHPTFNIAQVHFFPLGGIATNANFAIKHGATPLTGGGGGVGGGGRKALAAQLEAGRFLDR